MSQTIVRLYDNAERAQTAAHALRHFRFIRFTDVHVIEPPDDPSADGEATVQAIMKAMVLKAHARVYAEGVKRGGGLVVVHAPFGTALDAITVLERHGPIDSGVPEPREPAMVWDSAAPCSSLFRIPTLLGDDQTFSRFWGVPVLSRRGGTTSATLGLPELSARRGPYKGMLGLPLLSSQRSPLSALLGLPLLVNARSKR